MFDERRGATSGVVEGVDAGALRRAGVENWADGVADDEPVVEPDGALVDDAVRFIVVTAVVGTVVELADGADALEGAGVVVGVAAIGCARIINAAVERARAVREAPTDATTADRRERTGCVRRNNVATVPLKCCPCALMDSILRNQKQRARHGLTTRGQMSRSARTLPRSSLGDHPVRWIPR